MPRKRQNQNTGLGPRVTDRRVVLTKINKQKFNNEIMIHNRTSGTPLNTDVNGIAEKMVYIAPSFTGNGAMSNVAACYELMKPGSVTFKYQPSVGTTTGGVCYMGFLDNPDMIAQWSTYSLINRITIVKNLPNVVSTQLYNAASLTVNTLNRRNVYTLDSNITTTNAEQIDRVIPGALVLLIEAGPATSYVGAVITEQRHTLRGLINPAATTLIKSSQSMTDVEWSPPIETSM